MKQYILEWKDVSGQDVYSLHDEDIVKISKMVDEISKMISGDMSPVNLHGFKKKCGEMNYGLYMQFLNDFLINALLHHSPQDYVNIKKSNLTIYDGDNVTHYKPS